MHPADVAQCESAATLIRISPLHQNENRETRWRLRFDDSRFDNSLADDVELCTVLDRKLTKMTTKN
jgi:hypothetical protein